MRYVFRVQIGNGLATEFCRSFSEPPHNRRVFFGVYQLNELVPDLMKLMDEKKLGFTTAVELSYIGKKNQNYIAVAIDSQQSSPSQAQAKRMRELDEKKLLNGDVIDGIMMEDKKEVDKVILTGAELSKYFGKETTPREMKDQIIKLLDDWKG